MKDKYKRKQIENLITNISSDIDDSLRKKITDSRLTTSILHNKKLILEYISKEKLKISKSINNVTYKSRRGIDEYLAYLQKDPYNDYLRRDAVKSFIIISILGSWKHNSVTNFFDSKMYTKIRDLDPIKSYIQRAILLEYSFFLTDEYNKTTQENFKQEESKQLESDNIRITWQGNPTELVELIRALFLNKSIIGKIGETTNKITSFFDIEIEKPYKLYENIKDRNIGSETLFLNQLKLNLFDEIDKIKEEELKQLYSKQLESNNTRLTWQGNSTELIELIIALFLYKRIIGKIGELVDKIANFFNIEIKEVYKSLEHIKERVHNSDPIFIDQLKTSLYLEIVKKRKEKSKKNRQ